MRVLGLDLGLKRSGIALSDSYGLSVRLLGNLAAKNQSELITEILDLVEKYEVCVLLIGQPEVLNKASETIAKRAQSLVAAIKNHQSAKNLQVILWDESYSSKKAMSHLVISGVPRQKRREKLDSAAAAVLVEDYLYWCKNKSNLE